MKSSRFLPAAATGVSLLLLAAATPAATPCHDYSPSSAVQSWLALMGSKTDVVIAGQQVYVATDVQRLYGVSFADPGAIEQTWSFERLGPDVYPEYHCLAVAGGLLYAGFTTPAYPSRKHYLSVIDPANQSAPLIGDLEIPDVPAALHLEGSIAYMADAQGLRILDLSGTDPNAWRIVSSLALGECRDICKAGAIVYLAGGSAGVHIVNCGDLESPVLSSTIGWPAALDLDYYAVRYVADTLYLGNSGYFELADATDKEAPVYFPRRIAHADCVRGLAIVGGTVYAAASSAGVTRIDCSDPAQPLLRGVEPPSGGWALRLAASGDVVLPAEGPQSLRCLDGGLILNRDFVLGSAGTLACVMDMDKSGDHLFVANGDGSPYKEAGGCGALSPEYAPGLEVIDVSNPAVPVRAGAAILPDELGFPQPIYGIKVSGALAVIGSYEGQYGIFKVDEPVPRPLCRGTVPWSPGSGSGKIGGIDLAGGHAYLGSLGVVAVLDLADPSQPMLRDYLENCLAHDVRLVGDDLFVAEGSAGLAVIDASDPGDLRRIGGWQDGHNDSRRLDVRAGKVYLVDARFGYPRLCILDVAQPASPVLLATVALPVYPQDVAVTDRFAYVANLDAGVSVVNIEDPAHPVLIGTVSTSWTASAVCVDGGYVYLGEAWNRVSVLMRHCDDHPVTQTRYANVSAQTGLNYQGLPNAALTFDHDGDGDLDLFLSLEEERSQLFEQRYLTSSVPWFQRATDGVFPAPEDVPQSGLRGLAAADFDNDGWLDFFAADSTNARLYRNHGGVFVDQGQQTGVKALAGNSRCGSWADYDGDGWVDLFIGTGIKTAGGWAATPDVLLRNRLPQSGGFEDATQTVGIGDLQTANLGSAWGDADGDGDSDLLVGNVLDYSGGGACAPVLFLNNGDGTFTSQAGAMQQRFPDHAQLQGITGVLWEDFDNDGSLDLAMSSQAAGWVQPWVLLNDGSGYFNVKPHVRLPVLSATTGLRALDHDLDGRLDLLLTPAGGAAGPWLFGNKATLAGAAFVDETAAVGLDQSGTAVAVVTADFNGDGDPDVYLGRPVQDQNFFYQARMAGGGDLPEHGWTGVRVHGYANNAAGIGTVVKVTAGDLLQARRVDGGSGRGGQNAPQLLFGIGDHSGALQAEVTWPSGFSQNVSLVRDGVVAVCDEGSEPQIPLGSVTASHQPKPGGLTDWIFTWETSYRSDADQDLVTITDAPGSPGQCLLGQTVELRPGDPGVVGTLTAKAGGGYEHKVIWQDRLCVPNCTYDYKVASATACAASAPMSGWKQLRVRVCAQ